MPQNNDFSHFYNDNVILFTDGMANEGFTETEILTEEMISHINSVKEECQFDDDYTVKLSTLGTGEFYPGQNITQVKPNTITYSKNLAYNISVTKW